MVPSRHPLIELPYLSQINKSSSQIIDRERVCPAATPVSPNNNECPIRNRERCYFGRDVDVRIFTDLFASETGPSVCITYFFTVHRSVLPHEPNNESHHPERADWIFQSTRRSRLRYTRCNVCKCVHARIRSFNFFDALRNGNTRLG